ncbi:DUF4493 domain-containing protein [Parabacteroides acidifaciens]|nr:DUF4493 domain-containing protein [Parabacteroides acidifaciens]
MKLQKYTYIVGLFLSLALFSCEMKKDLLGGKDKTDSGNSEIPLDQAGLLDLELKPYKEADIPDTKGGISGSDVTVIDVNDFTVDILDSIGQVYKHYESYSELKGEGGLLLPIGKYSVRATLGEDVNAGFDAPFYSGSNACEISPKEVIKVITDCVLSNKKIVFRCSDEFLSKFSDDYSVVIDNGSGALSTFKDETRIAYLKNTGVLQFTLYATTANGAKDLIYSLDLSKNSEVQEHNNILVDLGIVDEIPDEKPSDPTGPTDPDEPEDPGDDKPEIEVPVKAPQIKVDISLVERDYIIEIPSNIVDPDDPSGGEEEPTVGKPTIVGQGFDIKNPVTVPKSNPNKVVKVSINTPGKLKVLQVDISEGLWVALDVVKLDHSFDMCNPTDQQKEALQNVKLPLPTPNVEENEFDITEFVPMIAKTIGVGTYDFKITVKDHAGQSTTATLTIEVTNN